MRRFWLAVIALLLLYGGVAVGNYAATVGAGTNFGSVVIAGVHFASQLICDFTTANQCASVTASNALKVDNSAVTQPVSNAGTFAAQLTGATNNINNIAGTVSLPTGAATSANQTNGTQQTKVTDGSNIAAVKAASTAPLATDPAVVVSISPNSVNSNGQKTMTNSAPVVIASDQSSVPVTVSTSQATNAGAALVKGGVGIVNGGSRYQHVAASQTGAVLQSSTGATGDYLSHCVIYPSTTAAGSVTVYDNTNAAANNVIEFTTGTLSNLAPIAVPVGAISRNGAWKVDTGANETVVCYGSFS